MLLTFYLAMHLNLFWENHRISITRDSILLSCLLLAKQHCSVEQFDPVSFFWGSTGDWDGSVHEKSINASHVTVPDISFKKQSHGKRLLGILDVILVNCRMTQDGEALIYPHSIHCRGGIADFSWEILKEPLYPADTPSIEDAESLDECDITGGVTSLRQVQLQRMRSAEFMKPLNAGGLSWLAHLCNAAWRSGVVLID